MNRVYLLAAVLVFAKINLLVAQTPQAQPTTQQKEFFESRIRPVLIEHCYECHNSEDATEGDLAVDHRKAMLAGGEGGAIIVPGNAGKSRLIAILRHDVDGLEMPENGPKLDEKTIADFKKWINDGAIDPRDKPPSTDELAAATSWESIRERRKQWWSFQPIKKTTTKTNGHVVDEFVDKKIAAAKITPAASAEPHALVRRLFFTLIGLPPSPEQAIDWTQRISTARNISDLQSSKVVNELIDELIDSPRFGERWARHWMDWIRYAESHGSEGDPRIDNAWMYRDYLIRALNADVPYDQLVREHIAGDLLDNPRINAELGINESMIGTAHWRMVFHGFAPTDALDERVRYTDDQINAFSKSFLGLTVSCARCHNHKFDAISQKDYYALFGVLASCRPARKVIDTTDRQNINKQALADLKPTIRDAVADDWIASLNELPGRVKTLKRHGKNKKQGGAIARLVADFGKDPKTWGKLADELRQKIDHRKKPIDQRETARHWDLSKQADYEKWFSDGVGLDDLANPAGSFAVAPDGDKAIVGIYPGGIYSHLLSEKHPARLTSPDFRIGEKNELWVQVIGDKQARVRYSVHDYPRNGTVYPVTNLPNQWRWQRYDVTYWNGDDAHIELAAGKDIPLLAKNENRSWFGVRRAMVQPIGQPNPEIRNEAVAELLAEDAPADNQTLLETIQRVTRRSIDAWKAGKVTDDQALYLDTCLREGLLNNEVASLKSAGKLINRYRELENAIPVPTRVPGLDESLAKDWPLYLRGNHKTPSDAVERRFLEAIDPAPFDTTQSGRRELAEKLFADANPLTRRVIVNRIWHHLFGRGIVATPDNFGRMGEQPSHGELLDNLAIRFSDDGWSIKKMIRLIVTSRTWQRSVQSVGNADEIDPGNELLSHANTRRLEAEAIRDSMFAVSGQLEERLYGPPVGSNDRRRSVYVRVIRNSLDPFLRVFDFPEPFSTKGRRDVTNVPAQSLTLLNDPLAERHARQWAQVLLNDRSLTTPRHRIEKMFLTAFGRSASADEISQIETYFDQAKERIASHRQNIQRVRSSLQTSRERTDQILQPVRQRLLDAKKDTRPQKPDAGPSPVHQWDFAKGPDDLLGSLKSKLQRGARIENGALVLDGKGYLVTSPLDKNIQTKTLEAWVQMDDLNQRGGGAITLQTPNGQTFDSIVFGERDPRQWMSGSNSFARTQGFNAPQESDATKGPVHVAIVYQSDGSITGYRNGVPYGKTYKSNGPFPFKKDNAVVSFGVRHLPATGGRMLKGRIFKANLYDRALTADEIAFTSGAQPTFLSQETILAALSDAQRSELAELKSQIAKHQSELTALGKLPGNSEQETWTDLARAIFTFKEFIYLR